ncbi:MAG: amidohydrolase family protein [Treponema sp.]|nr:amidohydrolase family protein [Treponema sp.]
MTDNHVHIGQFKDVFYDPLEITEIVLSSGMEGMSFSSTSSCKDGIQYSKIEKEIGNLLSCVPYTVKKIKPFFWYNPDYIHQNITIESAFDTIPYKGIKIHPLAHKWDFDNTLHMEVLHHLFHYASMHNLPILIHTGLNGVDNADRFERFINEYHNAQCILAHCRPLDITINMLSKYNNVYCDTAFVPETDITKIISAGFRKKIILGSDFPITHFYRTKYPQPGENPTISLREKYAEDITGWEKLENGNVI